MLQIKAVELNPETPFTWASGWKSPIYCDNRKILSYPKIRTYVRQEFAKLIEKEFGSIDGIAGVATGGIGIGALVAQELDLPFSYIRSTAKGHGKQNQVEGVVEAGQNIVVIEDLISTGGSSLKAVEALKPLGVNVKALMAIFTYSFKVSEDAFADESFPVYTLSNYETLVEQAADQGYIKKDVLESLREWKSSPSTWKQ